MQPAPKKFNITPGQYGTPYAKKAAKAPKSAANSNPIDQRRMVDDKIYRTMPITEKQLGQIKKHYGIQ